MDSILLLGFVIVFQFDKLFNDFQETLRFQFFFSDFENIFSDFANILGLSLIGFRSCATDRLVDCVYVVISESTRTACRQEM